MKKIVIITILGSIALLALAAWGRSAADTTRGTAAQSGGATNPAAPSAITASEKLYDFGTISMKNGLVTKDFTVTNSGEKEIYVPSLTTSCMCTKAYIVKPDGLLKGPFGMASMGYVPLADETLKPGESRIIRVVYDPNAHGPAGVGKIDRFVTLKDATGATLQLEIRAMVTP